MNSFKRNLLVGYTGSLLLLVVSAVASYASIENLISSQVWVNHTNTVINKLEIVLSVLRDAETSQRGYLLTGNEDFLQPFYGSRERIDRAIDDIETLTSDNPAEQESIKQLRDVAEKRIISLQERIDNKKSGVLFTPQQLLIGNGYMAESRRLVQIMESREQLLLTLRTNKLNKFAQSTPAFIITAGLLALLVTVFSFIKVNKDLDKRLLLQKELEEKDLQISQRLTLMRGITEKISAGDYKIRISDEGNDVLGELSDLLNKMTGSLDTSFENLKTNAWLQKGIAGLNEKMLSEKNLDGLTYNIIEFVTGYVNAPVGALYTAA